jgi:uncharacterized protein (TIRG00374 family)
VRRHWRLLLPLLSFAVAIFLLWWRGPDWHSIKDAFTVVRWRWVVIAILLNLLSIIARALAWDTVIRQSVDPPFPRFPLVFSAFSVGLFANALLPGRVGEFARVAVLRRRMPQGKGTTATLVGSVFAHRIFDIFPALTLVIWVLFAAKIPRWAYTSLIVVLGVGLILFVVAWAIARLDDRETNERTGRIQEFLIRIRQGLAVIRKPVAAARAGTLQFAGWGCQLFAVWAAMRAFDIHLALAAAGLVLVLMNVATIFPFWPGNFGLVQLAVATPLVSYGVAYTRGFAFGIGLQAIEASVGIGIGLIFLAREGLSYATLKQFEDDAEDAADPVSLAPELGPELEQERGARARVSG